MYVLIYMGIYMYKYIYMAEYHNALFICNSLPLFYWLLFFSSGKPESFESAPPQSCDLTGLGEAFLRIFIMIIQFIYTASSSPGSNYF